MILISILSLILALSISKSYTSLNSTEATRISALSLFYAGILSINALYIHNIGSGIGLYCGLFQITYTSLFYESFLYFIGGTILLSSLIIYQYNVFPFNIPKISIKGGGTDFIFIRRIYSMPEFKYYSLIALFSTLGGAFLLSSADLLSMYLSIELQSFALYILATLFRDSGSTSAGLKYFLLGGLSSCLILLGGALIYSLTGLTGFDSINSLVASLSSFDPFSYVSGGILSSSVNAVALLEGGVDNTSFIESIISTQHFHLGLSIGLIITCVGFLFKISAAPFHNWSLGPLFLKLCINSNKPLHLGKIFLYFNTKSAKNWHQALNF